VDCLAALYFTHYLTNGRIFVVVGGLEKLLNIKLIF